MDMEEKGKMEELLDLYNQAKESYYNGSEIMSDMEFDRLEEELGLENNSYIGSRKQKSYTIKHPFIMGSLSKVQVKIEEDGTVDFCKVSEQVKTFLRKSKHYGSNEWRFEITPKYDGCSWECVIDFNTLEMVSVSTRGDGEYGKDIKQWFVPYWYTLKEKLDEWVSNNEILKCAKQKQNTKYLVIRGECLVEKTVFINKYSEDFTMPRSFVSSCLNQDWKDTEKQNDMRNSLKWVCYDYRIVTIDNEVVDIKELDFSGRDCSIEHIPGNFPRDEYMMVCNCSDLENFEKIYSYFKNIRNNIDFELDGFVIKPCVGFRIQDNSRSRQEDCVAVKFLPETVVTNIVDILWVCGKTMEYFPTGILEECILGGKKICKVSLHNYDWIIKNKCGIGSCVEIVLSGDIIPNVSKILTYSDNINIPDDIRVDVDDERKTRHLMRIMNSNEYTYQRFINSVNALKIEGIAENVATKLYNIIKEDNIIKLMKDENIKKIKETLGESKSTNNIVNSLIERRNTLTLYDIILSLCLPNCGEKNSMWLAEKISGVAVDTKGIPSVVRDISDDDNIKNIIFNEYVIPFNIEMCKNSDSSCNKIPVILTGSPSSFGYKTKKEFLEKNNNYIETSKFSEAKILFCDDLMSNTSKMEKARKMNIEIRLYE